MVQQWLLDIVNFKFRCIQDVFQSRIPEGANWVMRFAYGVIAGGTDAELLEDKGVKVNLGQAYLASMCGEVFESLGVRRLVSSLLFLIWHQMVPVLS